MAIDNEDLRNAMAQMSGQQAWPHQLGAIEAMRAARPVGSPVAGGTPTQRRREAEESARQFEEQMKLQREQMALQERLARMARSQHQQQQSPGLAGIAGVIKAATDQAIRSGDPFRKVEDTLHNPLLLQHFQAHGVGMDQVMQLAQQYYGSGLQSPAFATGVTATPRPNIVPGAPAGAIPYMNPAAADLQTKQVREGLLGTAQQDWQRYLPPPTQQQPLKEGWYGHQGDWHRIGDIGHPPPLGFNPYLLPE